MSCLFHFHLQPDAQAATTCPELPTGLNLVQAKIGPEFPPSRNFKLESIFSLYLWSKLTNTKNQAAALKEIFSKITTEDISQYTVGEDYSWLLSLFCRPEQCLPVLKEYHLKGNSNVRTIALETLRKMLPPAEFFEVLQTGLQKKNNPQAYLRVASQAATFLTDPQQLQTILELLQLAESEKRTNGQFLGNFINLCCEKGRSLNYQQVYEIAQRNCFVERGGISRLFETSEQSNQQQLILQTYQAGRGQAHVAHLLVKILKRQLATAVQPPLTTQDFFQGLGYTYNPPDQTFLLNYFQQPAQAALRSQLEELICQEAARVSWPKFVQVNQAFLCQFLSQTNQPEKIRSFFQNQIEDPTVDWRGDASKKNVLAVMAKLSLRLHEPELAEQQTAAMFAEPLKSQLRQGDLLRGWLLNPLVENYLEKNFHYNNSGDCLLDANARNIVLAYSVAKNNAELLRRCFLDQNQTNYKFTAEEIEQIAHSPALQQVIRQENQKRPPQLEKNVFAEVYLDLHYAAAAVKKNYSLPAKNFLMAQLLPNLQTLSARDFGFMATAVASVAALAQTEHLPFIKHLFPASPQLAKKIPDYDATTALTCLAKIKQRTRLEPENPPRAVEVPN